MMPLQPISKNYTILKNSFELNYQNPSIGISEQEGDILPATTDTQNTNRKQTAKMLNSTSC